MNCFKACVEKRIADPTRRWDFVGKKASEHSMAIREVSKIVYLHMVGSKHGFQEGISFGTALQMAETAGRGSK